MHNLPMIDEEQSDVDLRTVALALIRLSPFHRSLFLAERLHEMERREIAARLNISADELDQHMRVMFASFYLAVDDIRDKQECNATCH